MKVLLTISALFCFTFASSVSAQTSPYIGSAPRPASNVRVMPLAPNNTVQPRGYHFGEAPALAPSGPAGAVAPRGGGYLEHIRSKGKVSCGTDTNLKSFARLEDGIWYGIDADFCKAIALAVLGDSEKIEMVNVGAKEVSSALANGKIDVMLSGVPFNAMREIKGGVDNAGLLYYDQQLLMVSDAEQSPEFYRGKKICLATDSDYYRNFEEYSNKNNLDFKDLPSADMSAAKENFLLNRCQMITGGALFLGGIKQSMKISKAKIYSDQIAITPVYALVRSHNKEFAMAVKWIINALMLAEQYGINAQNLSFFASHNNPEIRNLMGDDPKLWQSLGLRSFWVNDAVRLLGNYGDIYDRNIGADSDYKIERRQGKLVKDGGIIYPLPFM